MGGAQRVASRPAVAHPEAGRGKLYFSDSKTEFIRSCKILSLSEPAKSYSPGGRLCEICALDTRTYPANCSKSGSENLGLN